MDKPKKSVDFEQRQNAEAQQWYMVYTEPVRGTTGDLAANNGSGVYRAVCVEPRGLCVTQTGSGVYRAGAWVSTSGCLPDLTAGACHLEPCRPESLRPDPSARITHSVRITHSGRRNCLCEALGPNTVQIKDCNVRRAV